MTAEKRHAQRRKPYLRRKPRAVQGQLRNLTHDARQKLLSWFREDNGFVTYKEIARRLRSEFDIRVGITTLGDYYRQNEREIRNPAVAAVVGTNEHSTADARETIQVRITAPPGFRVDVLTEEAPTN